MDSEQLLSGRYQTNSPNVITDTVDGEAIAIALDSGAYYSFNEGGTICWNLLRAGVGPSELSFAFAGDESALTGFVTSLLKDELLKEAPAGVEPPQVDTTLDLRDLDLSYEPHSEMENIFGIDPIHDVDPDTGWPVGGTEPHRDVGIVE